MSNKPKLKLAAFDMDGTLTSVRSSWEYLHQRLGIWDGQAERYQDRFLAGEISYEEFCRLDADMWKGMALEQMASILDEIPVHKSAGELIKLVTKMGARPALLSTGLKLLADRLAERMSFSFHLANELVHHRGIMTGEIVVHISTHPPGKTKGTLIKELMSQTGASQQETVAIGDSTGDMDMFLEAGLAIAVNPKTSDLKVLQAQIPNLVTVQHLHEATSIIKSQYDM